MADELKRTYTGTSSVYALLRRRSDGFVGDHTAEAWEAWADGDIGDYDVPLTDNGGFFFSADMPSWIADGVDIWVEYRRQDGGAPAITDNVLGSEAQTTSVTISAGSGTATYDLTTQIGQTRLYIPDKAVTPASDATFLDAEIQVFLDKVDTSTVETACIPMAAAGHALISLAGQAAQGAKQIGTLNFSKDTRGTSKELTAQAEALFAQAGLPPGGQPAAYKAAEWNTGPMVAQDIYLNQTIRTN